MVLTNDNTAYEDYTNVCYENYDDMYNTIRAGGSAWICDARYGEYYLMVGVCYPTSSGLIVEHWNSSILFPNGSYNLEEEELPPS